MIAYRAFFKLSVCVWFPWLFGCYCHVEHEMLHSNRGCLPRNAYMRHVSLCSNCLHKEHWLNLVAFLLLINYVHPELCSWKTALTKEGGGRQGQWVWSLALNMQQVFDGGVGGAKAVTVSKWCMKFKTFQCIVTHDCSCFFSLIGPETLGFSYNQNKLKNNTGSFSFTLRLLQPRPPDKIFYKFYE